MKLRRVVVTGLGAVSPIGNDVPTMWENAKNGVSGAGPITHFDAYLFKTQFACEVKGFDATVAMDRRELRKFDVATHFGVAAAVVFAVLGCTARGNGKSGSKIGLKHTGDCGVPPQAKTSEMGQ